MCGPKVAKWICFTISFAICVASLIVLTLWWRAFDVTSACANASGVGGISQACGFKCATILSNSTATTCGWCYGSTATTPANTLQCATASASFPAGYSCGAAIDCGSCLGSGLTSDNTPQCLKLASNNSLIEIFGTTASLIAAIVATSIFGCTLLVLVCVLCAICMGSPNNTAGTVQGNAVVVGGPAPMYTYATYAPGTYAYPAPRNGGAATYADASPQDPEGPQKPAPTVASAGQSV